MPSTEIESVASRQLLDALFSAASAAQDQALRMARAAAELHLSSNRHEVVETLASELQGEAIDVQLRLQMIQDAAVKLGAKRSLNLYDNQVADMQLEDTPQSRRLLAALEETVAAARAVDEEMGWTDEQGRPTGYYERHAIALLLLRGEINRLTL